MKAAEAREIAEGFARNRTQVVTDLARMWQNAILRAAKVGAFKVRECECDKLRTPTTERERTAAREVLKTDGYVFKNVATGPNESEWECSW